MKRGSLSKGIHLLPSLCSTGSMFCGFFSIVRSINGDHVVAAWALFFAAFFDLLDGRIARMTKTMSEFGKEYDSLVDLASFGLAPALLVYTWSLSNFRPIGWIFSFLFFACAALRLARFNVVPVAEKRKFEGLPTPPAACLLASLVLFSHSIYGGEAVKDTLALILVPLLAVLMVSRISYRSFKDYDVKKTNSFYVLIGASVVIGIIAINPDIVLFLGFLTYALSGPVMEIVLFRRRRQQQKPAKVRTRPRSFSVVNIQKNVQND